MTESKEKSNSELDKIVAEYIEIKNRLNEIDDEIRRLQNDSIITFPKLCDIEKMLGRYVNNVNKVKSFFVSGVDKIYVVRIEWIDNFNISVTLETPEKI